jgi:hypothetical protein
MDKSEREKRAVEKFIKRRLELFDSEFCPHLNDGIDCNKDCLECAEKEALQKLGIEPKEGE